MSPQPQPDFVEVHIFNMIFGRIQIANYILLYIFIFQQVQAHMIIIIHPGSLNLRIGRASDVNPHRILNAIARRRKPQGKVYRDTVLPRSVIKVSGH